MNEKNKQEKKETEQENSNVDSENGDNNKGLDIITEASEAAKRLEEANKKKEELLNREEMLEAKKLLSGESEAGKIPEKKEDPYKDPIEYSKAIMEGKVNPLEV